MLRKLEIIDGKIFETDKQDAPVLVYISPDENEKRYLIDNLRIDEHTLASSLDPDEQSRLEYEPEHIAIIFKRPKQYCAEDNFLFKVLSTGIFLFKDRLIIVMNEDAMLFDGKTYGKLMTIQDVLLKLIYRAISHFVEHLKGINMISNEIEQKINKSMENRHLLHLFTLEKSLVYHLNAINSNGMVIEKLKNNAVRIGFTQENVESIDDILIENNQCRGQTEIYSQVLAGLMDARASIVSNNLNVRMKTLTLFTIIIMLPTLVVSIFSMNVPIPFGFKDSHSAFWIIAALAGFSSAAVGFLWWNRRW